MVVQHGMFHRADLHMHFRSVFRNDGNMLFTGSIRSIGNQFFDFRIFAEHVFPALSKNSDYFAALFTTIKFHNPLLSQASAWQTFFFRILPEILHSYYITAFRKLPYLFPSFPESHTKRVLSARKEPFCISISALPLIQSP